MAGGNVVSHLKMSTGIESVRDGFINLHSFDNNNTLFAASPEKYSGAQLDGSGDTTRAGESIMAIFENAGTSNIYPENVYMHLRSSAEIALRTGNVRLPA